MSDVGDNNFRRYIYMGEEGEIIPRGATHIIVREDVAVILANAFLFHPNIVEVICHEDVEKIEEYAFFACPSLRRVIMQGVKIAERMAFYRCLALTNVECGKLEIIEGEAFGYCKSLRSINMSSARIVEEGAFGHCEALPDAIFGSKLERVERGACLKCTSLEWITIPLKEDMIIHVYIFAECPNLKRVDLVDGSLLHETIAALHFEEWRNDANEVIHSINQTLPSVAAGEGKAMVILHWIRSVLRQLGRVKAEHRYFLELDVAPTLQRFLPQDIVTNSILPFLELSSNSFE